MVRITKYINIFAKGYAPNWSEEIFFSKKINYQLLLILKAKKLLERFTEKNRKKNKPKRV